MNNTRNKNGFCYGCSTNVANYGMTPDEMVKGFDGLLYCNQDCEMEAEVNSIEQAELFALAEDF
jgi:hypothetical protein